jgi:hypothetical protein
MRKWLFLILALALWVAPAAAETTDAILDSLQHSAFRYFWHQANPANGLIRDRSQSGSPCSIASLGFGLSAICIAIDHGWITRSQGAARVHTALNTLWTLPQGPATTGTSGYRGFFYHFLHMNDGLRQWEWNTELSSIDTALLMAGILDCRQYFDGADATETQIRTLATQIYERVEWDWMVNPSNQAIRHGWRPDGGAGTFIGFDYRGYSEAMILYILALGSPTHPPANPTASWSAWTGTYNWSTQYGQTYVIFPPLFGHQYSHCWVDFRNKRDAFMQTKGIDYYENSRRATLAQQAYCIANPGLKPGRPDPAGYHATLWGLTAGDGPNGYTARGAPPPQNDDGTITPTAVIASLPFAPEICRPTIQNFWDTYKNQPVLPGPCESGATYWGPYGFRDGFNLATSPDWFDCDVIGIDQGPIIMMIENYQSGAVWNRYNQIPAVQLGLSRAGFVSTVGVGDPGMANGAALALTIGPNPFKSQTRIDFRLATAGHARLSLHDLTGREVARPLDEWRSAGSHSVSFEPNGLRNGIYWCRLSTAGGVARTKAVLLR